MYTLTTTMIYGLALTNAIHQDFEEPTMYTLEDGETYYMKAEYCVLSNDGYTMNGRCHSFSYDGEDWSDATSPGPTLKFIAGTEFNIVFINDFENSVQEEDECENDYCDMDNTNLHTHGLHLSSSQDDVLVDIAPGQNNTYTYTIPDDHYPGVHWYHPHNHGSVSHQIHFGFFGAIITEYPDESYYPDEALYTDGDEAYITNTLVFHNVFAVNTELCNCSVSTDYMKTVEGETNDEREDAGVYGRCEEDGKSCFHVYSACLEYCAFEGSRESSGFEYSVAINEETSENPQWTDDNDGIDQFVVINGIFNPLLTITAGYYRRLFLVNTLHQYYIHYQFPTECQLVLLGHDGVFFDEMRDMEQFGNELIISSGGRADVLIKCPTSGEYYNVTTISTEDGGVNTDIQDALDELERYGSDSSEEHGEKTLFTIFVCANGDDIIDELPDAFPPKPDYLTDLTNFTDDEISSYVDSTCACNNFDDSYCADSCCIHYNGKDAMMVNGEVFSSADRYLTYLIQGRVYEFTLKSDRHVHHQHVQPFQLVDSIDNLGFIGQSGDFFDTIGFPSETQVRMYFVDFSGYMMIHCHLLPHEDMGMMALLYVLTEDEADGTDPTPSPSLSPTDDCLSTLYSAVDSLQDSSSVPTSPTAPTAPTPEPTSEPTPSPTRRWRGKRSASFGFDFQVSDINGVLIVIVSVFIALTLCNTLMICRSNHKKQKYSFIVQKDIDDI